MEAGLRRREARITRFALGVVLAIVLGVAVSDAFAGEHAAQGRRTYTFDEAVAAGLVPSLQQQQSSGLPVCDPGGTGGYVSPEALKAAVESAPEQPTCMADPRPATYGVSVGPGALQVP